MKELIAEFVRHKRFLQGVSENTVYFYSLCFKAWEDIHGDSLPDKQNINEWVIRLRERGTTPNTCDAYARGFNAFLNWLHQEGHIPELLKVKRPKLEKKVMKVFTEAQLRAVVGYRPKNEIELRTHTLILVALDTGARINELLTLTRDRVDLDNLLITVCGKGNKERIIPFSVECRKVLYKWLRKQKFSLVFSTRHGGKLIYDNTRKDFNKLLESAGVPKSDGAWHSLRRFFATNYIRNNGNPLKLQRMLGHSTLKMTNDYVKLVTDDLSEEQHRTSILNRLR
jgi:integrase/recombinase XerD